MVIVSLLIMPMPRMVRSRLVRYSDFLQGNIYFRNIIGVSAFFTATIFLDGLRNGLDLRSLLKSPNDGFIETIRSPQYGIPSAEMPLSKAQLAKMFHAQRNVYLTGAVLFLGLVIPTVVNVLRTLIKCQEKLAKPKGESDPKKVEELKEEIRKADTNIGALKKQLDNLQIAYNKAVDESGSETSSVKKND